MLSFTFVATFSVQEILDGRGWSLASSQRSFPIDWISGEVMVVRGKALDRHIKHGKDCSKFRPLFSKEVKTVLIHCHCVPDFDQNRMQQEG